MKRHRYALVPPGQFQDSQIIEGVSAQRFCRLPHCAHVSLAAIENDKSGEIAQDWLMPSALTSIRKGRNSYTKCSPVQDGLTANEGDVDRSELVEDVRIEIKLSD